MRAYPYETQEMVFDAHAQAFRFFGDASPLTPRSCYQISPLPFNLCEASH